MIRFVALGDSVTSGYGDPMPRGAWRGWAALLAEALGADATRPADPLEFHNLAVSGARIADVAERQLPAALSLRPTLASGDGRHERHPAWRVRPGRARPRPQRSGSRAGGRRGGGAHRSATGPGSHVRASRGSGSPARTPNGRVEHPSRHDRCRPRHHPRRSRRCIGGHGRVRADELERRPAAPQRARSPADRFPVRGSPAGGGPPSTSAAERDRHEPRTDAAQRLWWMATRGNRWLLRRSIDLIPTLARLAADDWWDRRRTQAPQRLRPTTGPDHDAAVRLE
jgi:GDSL-like Lipase/Acylhydrolase family